MDDAEKKELWEFVGAVKTRLDAGDTNFTETKRMITDLTTNVAAYHKKLDNHLTLHKYIHRVTYGFVVSLVAWWRA